MGTKIEAITVALENERRERDFYLGQSEKTDNPVGKKMFLQFAAEEDEHYHRLQSIHEKLAQQGKWPDTVSAAVGESNIHAIFEKIAGLVKKTPQASRSDIDALHIAIDFETKAHGFYTQLSTEADAVPEKEFFRLLALMEREHLLTLQESLLFFEHPEDWFAEHEKSQLEG